MAQDCITKLTNNAELTYFYDPFIIDVEGDNTPDNPALATMNKPTIDVGNSGIPEPPLDPAAEPTISEATPDRASIISGDSVTYTVTAESTDGGTLAYGLYSTDAAASTVTEVMAGTEVVAFQSENAVAASAVESGKFYYIVVENSLTGASPAYSMLDVTDKVSIQVQIDAPTDVTATATGTTTASISWTAPAAGGVDYYEITGDNGFTAVTTSAVTMNLSGLTKGTEYTFAVQSFSTVGCSQAVSANKITTWDVPGQAQNLSVAQSGSGSLRYSWTAPANNGGTPLTGYILTVKNTSGQAVTGSPFNLEASETTRTVTDLKLGTTYNASIAAKNSVGTGAEAAFDAKEAANLISAAEPTLTGDLTSAAIEKKYGEVLELTVTGTAESHGGSVISYQWYETTSKSAVGTPISGATKNTYKVKLEEGGTRYFYCVVTNTDSLTDVAENLRGDKTAAKKSTVATVTVEAAAPAAPKLSYEGADKSIDLSWDEPVDNGSPITGYALTVAEDDAFSKILTGYDQKILSAAPRSITIEGLDNAKTYYIKLTAVNKLGAGAAGTLTAQPYNGAYVEIKTEDEVVSGGAVLGTVELTYASGKPIADPTRIPKDRLVLLKAVPEEGFVFSRWVRTNLGGSSASMEIGDTFSLDQTDVSRDNPLTVKASQSSEYAAEFVAADRYEEDTFQITDLWASQTSGAAFDRARDLFLLRDGVYGSFGFESMTKDYDLYLLKTDGKALDFTVTAATGSAVTVGAILAGTSGGAITTGSGITQSGISLALTEVPTDTQNKQLARGTLTLPMDVSDGDVLTVTAASPDGTEQVSYTVTIHMEAKDPKVALEVVQFQGSEKATLQVKMSEGYFNSAEFMVRINDTDVVEGFTDKNYTLFTGTMSDEKVDMEGSFTDQQTNMDRFLNVSSVRSDGTDLSAAFESAAAGGAANLSSDSAIIAQFYLKIKPDKSMTDIVNALSIYNVGETKDNNNMRDLRYGRLVGTEAGDEELDLIYLKEADFYYITGKINSELTGESTTRIKFDVFNKAGDKINDAGEVSVKPDGILEYRVPENDYKIVIGAGGYLSTTKNLIGVNRDMILSTLPLYAGDLNGDGVIDSNDRLSFLEVYHMDAADGGVTNEVDDIIYADFDGSDYVNAYDLGILLGNYGKTPVAR